tara:strand:- start:220 stop:903 length:684 start_codon:yes stop_codon:yes gene_type:complete
MKWKVALNAEEAAIWLNDLEEYSSLAEVKELIDTTKEPYPDSKYWESWQDFKSNFDEAVSLKEALWDEMLHAWRRQEVGEGRGSLLVLDSWDYDDECYESLSKKSCKVTKESLAAWVYEMAGLDRAKLIYPNFDPNNLPTAKFDSNTITKEGSSVIYPLKLQLAIDAHHHFFIQGPKTRAINDKIKGWLKKESIERNIKHTDGSDEVLGLSEVTKTQIAVIIKPDNT